MIFSTLTYEIGLEDIPRRGSCVLSTTHGPIALFRTEDDRVHALEDRCPHAGAPLSAGAVCDSTVFCALHDAAIDLSSGKVVGAPLGACAGAMHAVKTHAVRVVGDRVQVSIVLSSPPRSTAHAC